MRMGIIAELGRMLYNLLDLIWHFIQNVIIRPPTEWFTYVIDNGYDIVRNLIFQYFGETVGTIVLFIVGIGFLGHERKKRKYGGQF